jgi:hypothetical protein
MQTDPSLMLRAPIVLSLQVLQLLFKTLHSVYGAEVAEML